MSSLSLLVPADGWSNLDNESTRMFQKELEWKFLEENVEIQKSEIHKFKFWYQAVD